MKITRMKRGVTRRYKRDRRLPAARSWLTMIFIALLLAIVLRLFVVDIIRVEGASMSDTINENEFVIADKISAQLQNYSAGDIVICTFPGVDGALLKRIVALGGDTIEISSGKLIHNGRQITEDYVVYPPIEDFAQITVPEGHVFVMGDNRALSHDSRSDDVGSLNAANIIGIIRGVVWPPNALRGISADKPVINGGVPQ